MQLTAPTGNKKIKNELKRHLLLVQLWIRKLPKPSGTQINKHSKRGSQGIGADILKSGKPIPLIKMPIESLIAP